MKILIIGAVAAGTSAAAKARRNNEEAEIKIYEQDQDISYSGCGLPYYLGGEIEDRAQLVPRNVQFFKTKYNVEVLTGHQVQAIQPKLQLVQVRNLATGELFEDNYDKLVLATGASAQLPQIPGAELANIFALRNVFSADRIASYLAQEQPQRAVIIGSGFIGLEMAENIIQRGLEVTLVEQADQVMPHLDADMACYLADHLKAKGVRLILGQQVTAFRGDNQVREVLLADGQLVATDLVLAAIGVKPNVALAAQAGIQLGPTGAIQVNSSLQTNDANIYACGDCAESYSRLTGQPLYVPLGSTANKMGRIAGDQCTGGSLTFRGVLPTSICRAFDLTVAQTGLTEKAARQAGYQVVVSHNIKPDKPEYFHGQEMTIKAIADRSNGRILGAQIIGPSGVDKRIDIFVTAISFGAKAEDLFHLDLAYAPPFSTTKDPVMYSGMILDNALQRGREIITPQALQDKLAAGEDITIIDARATAQYETAHVPGAINLPQDQIRVRLNELDPDKPIVTYCNKGVTGNAVQNILLNNGFEQVSNLSGGHQNYQRQVKDE